MSPLPFGVETDKFVPTKTFENKDNILPILSMFIDDGKKKDVVSNNLEYWDKLIYGDYKYFVNSVKIIETD